jgi:hypothetical protein
LIGTEVISYGKSKTRGAYICLIGERAKDIDGYNEESHFWIFSESVENFTMQMYGVRNVSTRNLMRVWAADQSDIERPRKGRRFCWFVPRD